MDNHLYSYTPFSTGFHFGMNFTLEYFTVRTLPPWNNILRTPVLSLKQAGTQRVNVNEIFPNNRISKSIKDAMLPIDLKLLSETDDIGAVYVPLPKVRRLTDLVILRHFEYKALSIKSGPSQLAEIERLDQLYVQT